MEHQQQPVNNGAAPAAQKDDYLDKGLAFAQKKAGMKQDRAMNEKITDALRGLYEKLTGKKVSSKISN